MLVGLAVSSPGLAQTFATPLPPGPGTVGLPIPGGPLAAPVLMPLGAPTAAPVAIYNYGTGQVTPFAQSGGSAPPSTRFYVGAEFLFGAVQGDHLPPLITISPPGTPIGQAGALFSGTTFTFFGDQRVNNTARPGLASLRVTGSIAST